MADTRRPTLREHLTARLSENKRRHEEIKQRHRDAIDAKKARQRAKGLPPEKSPI